ncbi:MAG: endonuclease/exonuclease/phosphatase family protein [Candidatus Vogelbacteria bacterium]|nr:endonuclease/exonuclease/phosphatase family protein [Candidatus Vogelbacteria bacterium]
MSKRGLFVAICALLLTVAGCGNIEETTIIKREVVRAIPAYAGTEYVSEISKKNLPAGDIVVASWNACNFGRKKSPEVIVHMAQILRAADIVALQEISTSDFGAQAIAKLSDELNRTGAKWDYVVSDATHESPCKERFAFLWKTSRIEAAPHRATLCAVLANQMVREPVQVKLRIDKKFYFTLVSFHLAPTAKHPEQEVLVLPEHRQDFSNGNIMFVGDFNLGHDKLDKAFEDGLGARHNIQGETSLRAKDNGGAVRSYLSKAYDNIYTKGSIRVDRSLVVDFIPQCGDLKQARMVSDHLPVAIVCNVQ